MQVMILAGGLSHERDVSIRSGRRVWEALEEHGIKTAVRDVDTSLMPYLQTLEDTVVWPLLHGASGEDGSLQALLELVDAPFVGTGSREARVAWVKPVAKAVFSRAGVATPDYVTLPQSLFREAGAEQVLEAILAKFDLPLMVKPARGGSALGVSLVTAREQLAQAMVHCFAYGDMAMIERAVVGTEVAVSVIGAGEDARVLPAVEIVCDGPYDYDARYNPGRVEYFAPARLDAGGAAAVETAALIDINIAPGMTETSLLPQAIEASGQSLGDVYAQIVAGAVRR